jgi:hypothetical protein
MDREPTEHPLEECGLSPHLRERILRDCRRAMAERLLAERRAKQRRQGSLLAVVALLLLWNQVEEYRIRTRIGGTTAGRVVAAKTPQPAPSILRALRTRATLVAALLQDSNAL